MASFGCSDRATAPDAVPAGAQGDKADRGGPSNWISEPIPFAPDIRVASLAVMPSRLLGSTVGPAASKLVSFAEDGSTRAFAPTQFTAPAEAECHLEVATGVGEWVPSEVFASRATEIWQLSPDGAAARCFATLPLENDDITGICFDRAGQFGYDLLAITKSGTVYRIDVRGRACHVGSVGIGGRGPSVASARFAPGAGKLLVAFPQESEVRSLDVAGNVDVLLRWSGASGVTCIPDDPAAFGRTECALFVAAPQQVVRHRFQVVAGFAGALVVQSVHRSGSGLITAEGMGLRMRAFSRTVGPEIAAGFAQRLVVTPVPVDILPSSADNVVTLGSTGLLPVALLASDDFSPAALDGGSLRLAGAQPVTRGSRFGTFIDVNGDGRRDLLLQFRPAEMQLTMGAATLALEGATLAGDPVRGSDRVLVTGPQAALLQDRTPQTPVPQQP